VPPPRPSQLADGPPSEEVTSSGRGRGAALGRITIPEPPPFARRSLESLAARPLMSSPPPLDDLSDLLTPDSSRRPPPLPSFAPTPMPPSLLPGDLSPIHFEPGEPRPLTPPSSRKPSLLPPDPGPSGGAWVPRRAVAALGLAIRQRRSGALAQQAGGGVRRVLMRDGDILTVTSSREEETLTNFLRERGDVSTETLASLGPLPRFGRHAGAALIARGLLRQEDLWPVLRSHAEWILARMLSSDAEIHLEADVPARVSEEPAVFGGAAGAEIYMEVLQRAVQPRAALAALGEGQLKLGHGPNPGLLAEAALLPLVEERALSAVGEDLASLYASDPSLLVVLLGLTELGILTAGSSPRPAPPPPDVALRSAEIDDEALESRVRARRALVEDADYFGVLGVERTATRYEVERARDELRRQLAPERLTARTAHLRADVELILGIVEEAHLVLADDVRRERYRRALEGPPA
jgi:hypothetical protein